MEQKWLKNVTPASDGLAKINELQRLHSRGTVCSNISGQNSWGHEFGNQNC